MEIIIQSQSLVIVTAIHAYKHQIIVPHADLDTSLMAIVISVKDVLNIAKYAHQE